VLRFGPESLVFQFAVKNIYITINRTINLPVDLYGCETRLFTLRSNIS